MKFMVPFVAAAAVAATASAGFTGFSTSNSVQGDGKVVSSVFACFDGGSDTLLNVFQIAYTGGVGTSGFGAGNFWHADFANGVAYSQLAGSWNPTFTPGFGPGADSFVTIGGGPGFANSTAGDPSFGAAFNTSGLVAGAGWFNSNPTNLQGANVGGKTLIGQFVVDAGKGWFVFAKVGFNAGLGTPTVFGDGTFTIGVPAPGAIALLGLAGLAGRRRRA
jgi:hypothetical protein